MSKKLQPTTEGQRRIVRRAPHPRKTLDQAMAELVELFADEAEQPGKNDQRTRGNVNA